MNCYLCDKELVDEHISEEHILLDSIGGRLSSFDLLCRGCNRRMGNGPDRELAKQMAWFSYMLKVKRSRTTPDTLSGLTAANGEKYFLNKSGAPQLLNPKIEETKEPGKTNIHLVAADEKKMRQLLAKYPQLDIEAAMASLGRSKEYFPLTFSSKIGPVAFQSVVKSAVNYYLFKGGHQCMVQQVIDYLNDPIYKDPGGIFYPMEPPYPLENGEIVHLIHLNGNPNNRLLYCYIELFSCFPFVVKLSDEYSGESIESTYVYDLLKNEEVQKKVSLEICLDDFPETVASEYYLEEVGKLVKRSRDIAQAQLDYRHLSNQNEEFVAKYLNGDENAVITEEMLEGFIRELAEVIVLYQFRGLSSQNTDI